MDIIQVAGLNKRYKKNEVLKDISFAITPGEFVGYIGANGAGKTTTIKILTGMTDDYDGDVFVFGRSMKVDRIFIQQQIGYVPENANLYEVLTPVEYLDFVGNIYGMRQDILQQKIISLLRYFDLHESSNLQMTTFSKGMKQKVALIAALIHNPKIIFLDEALNGLDANTVILVKEMFQLLKNEGKTIFYTSHVMDVIQRLSDRIIIINNGEIIANGTFEALRENKKGEYLDEIFTELTGNYDYQQTAVSIIEALNKT